jgi:hypothetical protein
MQVHVVDETNHSSPVGPWSNLNDAHDFLVPKQDCNTVTFGYHYSDNGNAGAGQFLINLDQYQDVDIFKNQVALASEAFKDMDFQLITFNVPENDKFGSSMAELGFELMSSALGRSETPIYLYVKTKKG